jgi:hypothetical protein
MSAFFSLLSCVLIIDRWVRRVLPSSAISRVFFPSRDQLLDYCSPATLPAGEASTLSRSSHSDLINNVVPTSEYGGSLPTLDQIEDALRSEYQRTHTAPSCPSDFSAASAPASSSSSSRSTDPKVLQGPSIKRSPSSSVFLAPTSPLNPFFGYPVITSSSSPHTIRHVRRRRRDLVRTLAVLWWQRWGWGWGSRRAIGLVGVFILLVLSLIAAPARLKRIAISRLRVLGWLKR